MKSKQRGGIAQLARATGSYPVGHGFKSNSRYHRPVGQAAKTPPFHGGNGSSILPRVTKKRTHTKWCVFFFCAPSRSTRHMLQHMREFAFCEQGDGSSLTRAASKNIRQRRNSPPCPLHTPIGVCSFFAPPQDRQVYAFDISSFP